MERERVNVLPFLPLICFKKEGVIKIKQLNN